MYDVRELGFRRYFLCEGAPPLQKLICSVTACSKALLGDIGLDSVREALDGCVAIGGWRVSRVRHRFSFQVAKGHFLVIGDTAPSAVFAAGGSHCKMRVVGGAAKYCFLIVLRVKGSPNSLLLRRRDHQEYGLVYWASAVSVSVEQHASPG